MLVRSTQVADGLPEERVGLTAGHGVAAVLATADELVTLIVANIGFAFVPPLP